MSVSQQSTLRRELQKRFSGFERTALHASLLSLKPQLRRRLEADSNPRAQIVLDSWLAVEQFLKSESLADVPPLKVSGQDWPTQLFLQLQSHIRHDALTEFIVALKQLLELAPRYARQHSESLGLGFEALEATRLRGRFRQLVKGFDPVWLEQNLPLSVAAPDHLLTQWHSDFAPEDTLDSLERDLGEWLEAERRLYLLKVLRRNKTDHSGHIIRYLSTESEKPVLIEIGCQQHWRVNATTNLSEHHAQIKELEKSQEDQPRLEPHTWQHFEVSASRELPPKIAEGPNTQEWRTAITSTGVQLRPGKDFEPLQLYSAAQLETLLECPSLGLQRLADLVDYAPLISSEQSNISSELASAAPESSKFAPHWHMMLQRFVAARSGRRTFRLVYVPSELEHPLGGVPEVGLKFLADRAESRDFVVSRSKIYAKAFDQRIYELLGADFIGIGVYIHNRDEVAELCRKLKKHNFQGRIFLGGPEARTIEQFLQRFEHFDAVVRGEAEECFLNLVDIFDLLDNQQLEAAQARALTLSGCVIKTQSETWFCATRTRNQVANIECPLPFQWQLGHPSTVLKMNFTRGCPYLCSFCPNHQGRRFHAAHSDQMWIFSVFAAADQIALTTKAHNELIRQLCQELEIKQFDRSKATPSPIDLPELLALACLSFSNAESWQRLFANTAKALDLALPAIPTSDSANQFWANSTVSSAIFAQQSQDTTIDLTPWTIRDNKLQWLKIKTQLLAAKIGGACKAQRHWLTEPERFTIETSEDNTLVNKARIRSYLQMRHDSGLADYFIFNPGQNTVRDLMTGPGQVDEDYLQVLVENNPFAVAFGSDGTSNTTLRQNRKPNYKIEDCLNINAHLARQGIETAHNYILLTAESNLFDAFEAFLLFYLLPLPWRDYGASMNLRVIKEETTLATDEAILLQPKNQHWDVPLRDQALNSWLERHELTSMQSPATLLTVFFQELNGAKGRRLFDDILNSWLAENQVDRQIRALGQLLRQWLDNANGAELADKLKSFKAWLHNQCQADLDGQKLFVKTPLELWHDQAFAV